MVSLKTPNLKFIICHNVQIASYHMVVTTSVYVPSWNDDIRACALTVFIPYPLCKFRLTLSFSYRWICHLSVYTLYHILSVDYVLVRLVHIFLSCLCLCTGSYPFFTCIHTGFDSSSFYLHGGFNFFFVGAELNQISNILALENSPPTITAQMNSTLAR